MLPGLGAEREKALGMRLTLFNVCVFLGPESEDSDLESSDGG